jgi:Flp pilus assembly protein TadD
LAGIADTYASLLWNSDMRPSDAAVHARDAAAHAFEHGGTVAEAHAAAGTVQLLFDWDWSAAEVNLRRALALDPNSSQSHWMLGHVLSQQGPHDEARGAAQRARDLDPLNALSHRMSAQIAFSARDFEGAVRHARQALLAEPDNWVAHWQLGQAYERLDRVEEAPEDGLHIPPVLSRSRHDHAPHRSW